MRWSRLTRSRNSKKTITAKSKFDAAVFELRELAAQSFGLNTAFAMA